MPPPDPIGEYVMLIPYAEPTAGIHFEISGYGNVAPAPVSVVSCCFGRRRFARPATIAIRDDADSDERERKRSLHVLTLPFIDTSMNRGVSQPS